MHGLALGGVDESHFQVASRFSLAPHDGYLLLLQFGICICWLLFSLLWLLLFVAATIAYASIAILGRSDLSLSLSPPHFLPKDILIYYLHNL